MTSGDQATFIGQHLGPALAAAGLNPRVFAWDHNWETTYPFAVLSNQSAAAYISGVAFHCYGGQPDAMSAFHQAYPQLDIVLSECADGSRATFGDKLMYDVYTTLIGSLRNWARSVAKWNLVLDESGGPKLYTGACRNPDGARHHQLGDRCRRTTRTITRSATRAGSSNAVPIGWTRRHSGTEALPMSLSRTRTAQSPCWR